MSPVTRSSSLDLNLVEVVQWVHGAGQGQPISRRSMRKSAMSDERAQRRKNVSGIAEVIGRGDPMSQEHAPPERDEAGAAFRANERSWNTK